MRRKSGGEGRKKGRSQRRKMGGGKEGEWSRGCVIR